MPRSLIFTTLILGLFAFNLSGCASYFTRKACEKTNWYQHGYDVAMAGKRLDADGFIKQCRQAKADINDMDLDVGFKAGMAKYCTLDNIYEVGKAGHQMSYDLCDGESQKKMRERFTAGVRVFCQESNGYHVGSSGQVYENVCPKDLETAWLKEYRRGRKTYLNEQIGQKENERRGLESQISDLENQQARLQRQQTSLLNARIVRHDRIFDPKTGTFVDQTQELPDPHAAGERQELEQQMSDIRWRIQQNRNKEDALNSQLDSMRAEMVSL